jgi:DNA-binding transcriptional LysR family regulator
MAPDLNALAIFALVAEERSFRAAAERQGVTRSAISQTIRKLEESLGIALIQRTTRSVSLTEAGERLYSQIAPAVAEMISALEGTEALKERPRGRLRLAVSSIAERFLSGPLLATFLKQYPELELDIMVTDDEFDIVAEGYDAGVRLGEVIALDMIAVPIAGEERQLAVCAPSYSGGTDISFLRRLAALPEIVALSLGICRKRQRVQRCSTADRHHQRYGADDQAGRFGRRHSIRHGRKLPPMDRPQRTDPHSRRLLPVFRWLLSLLSDTQKHRAEASCADRACSPQPGGSGLNKRRRSFHSAAFVLQMLVVFMFPTFAQRLN